MLVGVSLSFDLLFPDFRRLLADLSGSSVSLLPGIQNLCKLSVFRHRDMILIPLYRSKVKDTYNLLLRFSSALFRFSDECYNAVICISLQQPFKSFRFVVQFVQSRFAAVKFV